MEYSTREDVPFSVRDHRGDSLRKHPRQVERHPRWALVPLAILLFGCVPYCELGGGQTDGSVTVDGDDGLRVLAKAKGAQTKARLEFERKTSKRSRGHEVSYVFSKTHITQELRLVINEGGDGSTFVVSEHDAASGFESHELGVTPDGKVVGYKLGDKPWRFVHVLTTDLAVHGPTEMERLNWREVPDVSRDGFRAVFNAQNLRLDGTHSFDKQLPMLEWMRDERGQVGLAETLFDLLPDDHHNWHEHTVLLDEDGWSHLRKLIRAELSASEPWPQVFAAAVEVGAIDLEDANPELVARGVVSLVAHKDTVANSGTDLAEYLRVHARHDPAGAGRVGCEVLGLRSELAPNGLPYAMDYGRPLALVALASVANAGHDCAALKARETDPCSACDSGPCTPEVLDEAVAKALGTRIPKPEMGKTPKNPELAARLAVAARGEEPVCP